ncbi:PIN domain-containing protein [Streptomyces sp. ME02-6991-2A]|uniref:PIN domain-containing protein n=1 Tax=Streptomyces sp. ME02-6991-2A TaxID=3028677 RepID=UPI0029BB00D3|nr:PIN domain-containing protein [Streptomyces sp. ME02-6991-2A]MDX3374696.1 PIN domain-containing protein [Streptomyces sp. ME02-6991-2A]
MIVTPIPGTHRDNVLSALRSVFVAAGNLDSQHHSSAYGRLLAYLEWADDSLRLLVGQISASDINRLIRTRMYQSLLDGVGHLAGSDQQRLVNGLLANEVRERVVALEAAVGAFQGQMRRWPAMTSVLVLDTSVFIKHETKLEDTDFFVLAGAGAEAVRVTVPMVVVDELDRLKESRDKQVRWRAGYSLAVLDRLLESNERLGRVKVEALFDNPGHVRLPDEDDEIVDRALAVHTIAAGSAQLVTYDTGMAMRAKWANLPVLKLRTDAGTGPEPEKR